MALFGKPRYTIVKIAKKNIPEGLWTKCEDCGEIVCPDHQREHIVYVHGGDIYL